MVSTEHWDLHNEEEKYDILPEIWEGHNVADFIDPEILEVRVKLDVMTSQERVSLNKSTGARGRILSSCIVFLFLYGSVIIAGLLSFANYPKLNMITV